MLPAIFLLAAASRANAAWLKWTGDPEPTWQPAQETGRIPNDNQMMGWTPRPTPAPNDRKEGEVVLELLRRASYSSTNWTNPETCGWISGSSSYPWTCDQGATCATNDEHAVACASGTYSPFYVSCFDYAAFKGGSCSNVDSATGCCQNSLSPACGTYIWTGSPVRSMFRCFTSTTIVSVLDEPQFVVDASISASLSSASAARASLESAARASSSNSKAPTTSDNVPSTTTATTETTATNSTTSIGTIVGGVIGGIGGLLAILLLVFCCCVRRRRKVQNTNYKLSYSSRNKGDTRVYNSRREQRSEDRRKNEIRKVQTRNGRNSKNENIDDATFHFSKSKLKTEPSFDERSSEQSGGGETIIYAPHIHYHITGASATAP